MVAIARTLTLVTLLAMDSPAGLESGSLHLAWNNCFDGDGAATQATLSCDPARASTTRLDATLRFDNDIRGVITVDAILDFTFGCADVPPFWQLSHDGCNAGGVRLRGDRPSSCSAVDAALCQPNGAGCVATLADFAFGPGVGLSARSARMLVTVARPISNPADLGGTPATTFAFEIEFSGANAAGSCAGCGAMADITWSLAMVYDRNVGAETQSVAAVASAADPESHGTVVVNPEGCDTPTRRTNWGRLKSLYR